VKRLDKLGRASSTPNGELPGIFRINRGATVHKSRIIGRLAQLSARRRKVQAVDRLLLQAAAIEMDLGHRLSKEPCSRTLLKQRKQYQRLVDQLLWEHKTAFDDFMAAIRH
jgi:hypothetical protein